MYRMPMSRGIIDREILRRPLQANDRFSIASALDKSDKFRIDNAMPGEDSPHRRYLGRKQNFTGFHFWSRGYCVSTVGRDEVTIRENIKNQESEERRAEAA